MAVEVARYFGRRKRKRGSWNGKRKLRVNERVEVRSMEDGLLGSWHPGTVILCEKLKRHVRYDNVLDDDGLDFLTEVVAVPDVFEGVSSSTCNRRGFIRPVPPFLKFESSELQYGLCVDANYQEAWWEGVIFDLDDGMQERRIFFPDLGDEIKIGIDRLRITQDWDAVTENWERRGNWVFLELVEECEQSSYIAVSVKQIWYDVRAKEDFNKINDWTFKAKNSWRDLVMEIIGDYFTLTLKELIPVLEISNGFLEKALEPKSVELTTDVHHDTSPINISGSSIKHVASQKEKGHSPTVLDTDPNLESITPIQERYGMHMLGGVPDLCFEEALKIPCSEKEFLPKDEPMRPVEEKLPQNPANISCYDSVATGKVVSGLGVVPILCIDEALKISCSEKEVLPQYEPVPPVEEEFSQNLENISCYDSGATGEVVGLGGVPILHIEDSLKISCPEKEVLPQDESMPPIEEKLPQNPENISCYNSSATGEVVSGLRGVPILCIEEAMKISVPEKEVLPQEESVRPIEEKLPQNPENISCYNSGATGEIFSGVSEVPILHIEEALKISCPVKEVLLQDESVPPVEEKLPQNPENISCYDSGIGEDVFGLGGVPILRIEEALKISCAEKEVLLQDESVPPTEENISGYYSGSAGKVVSGSRGYEKSRKFKVGTSSVHWKLLKLPGTEFCPDAVNEYVAARQRKTKELMKTKVRKHLAFLGWKIEFREKKTFYNERQYKYTSPGDEKCYMSLDQVCKHLKNETSMNSLPSEDSHRMMHPSPDRNVLHLHLEQPGNSWDPNDFPTVVPPPPVEVNVNTECFPQAIVEYYMMASNKSPKAVTKNMILKAKEQLLSAGWIISYGCKTRKQLTYTSPKQRTYHSLLRACSDYIKESISNLNISGLKPLDALGINEGSNGSDNLLHRLLQKEPELLTGNGKRKRKHLKNLKASLPKVEEKELTSRVLRSTKRVQKVHASSLSRQKTLNVLSWLIDSKVVLPRVKVYYQAIGKPRSECEGRITSYGIKCNCCMKTYSLRGFEGHASGSISHRPAVNIFLEDGRSLLDIQMQIMHDYQKRESLANPSSDWHQGENDSICSVCHYGGDLILCDQCPSSFHRECLGLEDIPDGDWFCPSCQCGICGQSKLEGIDDGNFLSCSQCEHKYHLWCLGNRRTHKSGRHGKNWFCSKNCKKQEAMVVFGEEKCQELMLSRKLFKFNASENCRGIYAGLQQLLGESVVVGENNLKWTLLKWVNSDNCHLSNNNNYLAESYCKLNVALGLMHECFETLKEPYSKRDLIEEVLFCRWSKLKRLNFQGFYTVLLEREDELISVATLRVYGEKVAEVPLVGTRVQYRQRGMCRVLMNELEKVLKRLGVERLVLSSARVTLDTWTNYFGFSKMTDSERKQFLDCTFLDFQQAIMCQKLLTKIPSQDVVRSKETKQKSHDILSLSRNIDFDGSSSFAEVHQAEDIKVSRITDPQLVDDVAANNDNLCNGVIDPVTMLKWDYPTLKSKLYQNVINSDCSAGNVSFEQAEINRGSFKYYKRRKLAGHDWTEFFM